MDRYVVIHVATTCDEHGVYVTKDSAEVIEIGWILLNAKTLEEVREHQTFTGHRQLCGPRTDGFHSFTEKVFLSARLILRLLRCAVCLPLSPIAPDEYFAEVIARRCRMCL